MQAICRGSVKPGSVTSSRRLTEAFAATEHFLQSIVFPDTTLLQKIPCDNKILRHSSTLKSRVQVKVTGNYEVNSVYAQILAVGAENQRRFHHRGHRAHREKPSSFVYRKFARLADDSSCNLNPCPPPQIAVGCTELKANCTTTTIASKLAQQPFFTLRHDKPSLPRCALCPLC